MVEVLRLIILIIFKVFYRVQVIGRENVPAQGAALLCSNHLGELDMLFIGFRIKRLVHYMAKEELFKNRMFAALITWLGAFPVKRGKADMESIKKSFQLLKDGHILGIFPEGTRTRKKANKDIKVMPGAAMFAVKAGAPVIPVAIDGSYRIFSKVKIVFGKPFYFDVEKGKKYTTEEFTEMSKDIMHKVYALLEEN